MHLKQILGRPKFVKADNGTEHSIIQLLCTYFSEVRYGFQINGAEDPLSTFSITTSPLNQRIKAYLSSLRQNKPG